MNYLPASLLLPVLFAAAARAGELTIEAKPFFTSQTFSATALPTATTLIRLDAKAWPDFEITQLASHGSKVAAGDVLVKFDTEDIDKKLPDARRAFTASELGLAQAELDFKNLTATTPLKLEAIRRAEALGIGEGGDLVLLSGALPGVVGCYRGQLEVSC